jgi:hypothetical protein
MRRFRWAAILMLSVLPFAGCSKGRECDSCKKDADCQSGLVCSNFLDSNGNVASQRCGSGLGVSTCRVR